LFCGFVQFASIRESVMERLDKTTRKFLFMGVVTAALPLVAALFLSSHSFIALSKDHLFRVVWSREEDAVEQEIRDHASNDKTYGDMLARWQLLRKDLVSLGATGQVAANITTSMQGMICRPNGTFPSAHWPVMVRRGWIMNKPLWVVITAYPKYVKSPLRGKQLKVPLTHRGGAWDKGITLFDVNGEDVTH
jgi:hypothetical protein